MNKPDTDMHRSDSPTLQLMQRAIRLSWPGAGHTARDDIHAVLATAMAGRLFLSIGAMGPFSFDVLLCNIEV